LRTWDEHSRFSGDWEKLKSELNLAKIG
jgi:hypothetical protein